MANDVRQWLMAGVPTAALGAHAHGPRDLAIPIGLVIGDGFAFSLDGKSILVGHVPAGGAWSIEGAASDGTFPQQRYRVEHGPDRTVVTGAFSWQAYTLTSERAHGGMRTKVAHEDPRHQFVFEEAPDRLEVKSAFQGRHFTVAPVSGKAAVLVKAAWSGHDGIEVEEVTGGALISPAAGTADSSITVTRAQGNALRVEGSLQTQCFDLTPASGGWDVKGHYNHQCFTMRRVR